ncbi:hypothetical protein [Ornithinimicrobium kibberense]|uniref:hypothetical protein n=1 Tax=Ornithinimicrobium kibberense TaxID=282060 RepID=UPI00360B94A0
MFEVGGGVCHELERALLRRDVVGAHTRGGYPPLRASSEGRLDGQPFCRTGYGCRRAVQSGRLISVPGW